MVIRKRSIIDNICVLIMVIAFVVNTVSINIIPPIFKQLIYVGYVLLVTGIFLLVLAIITLRRKGTHKVIDTGIYGVVRHPIYLAGMILFLSHVFFGQHWIVFGSTAIAIGCCYMAMWSGDQWNIEKFGDDYVDYMKRVPGMNFLSGLKRYLHNV